MDAGLGRRLIIKFCITTVRPAELSPVQLSNSSKAVNGRHIQELLSQPSEALQKLLLQVEPLPRFVFVIRAMEGCNRRDTALLLNIDDRTCESAYAYAVEALRKKHLTGESGIDKHDKGTNLFQLAAALEDIRGLV